MTAPSHRGPVQAPTTEELAAVVAAIEAVWPRPGPPEAPSEPVSLPWRFSGRWWSPSTRRDGPWVGRSS